MRMWFKKPPELSIKLMCRTERESSWPGAGRRIGRGGRESTIASTRTVASDLVREEKEEGDGAAGQGVSGRGVATVVQGVGSSPGLEL